MEFAEVSETVHSKQTAQYCSAACTEKHASMRIHIHALKTGAKRFSERGKFDYMRCARHAILAYVETALFSKVKDGLPFVPKYVYTRPPSVVQAAVYMLDSTSVTRFLHHAHLHPSICLSPNTAILHKYL